MLKVNTQPIPNVAGIIQLISQALLFIKTKHAFLMLRSQSNSQNDQAPGTEPLQWVLYGWAPPNFSNFSFLPLNLHILFKRNMVSPPNSSYFLYDTNKLVQFYICYYPPPPPIHEILVPPLPSTQLFRSIQWQCLTKQEILSLSCLLRERDPHQCN